MAETCRGLIATAAPSTHGKENGDAAAAHVGLPFQLQLSDSITVTTPLKSDQVMLRVSTCALSSLDAHVFAGLYDVHVSGHDNGRDGVVLGFEVCGVVAAVGSHVQRLAVGQRVAGILPCDAQGALAELVVAAEYFFVPVPAAVSDVDAVTCLVSGARTYLGLQFYVRSLAGESILLPSASAESLYVALQLIARWKLSALVAVNSPSELEFLRCLPFKSGTPLDLSRKDLVRNVMFATGGLGADIVFDVDRPLVADAAASGVVSVSSALQCLALGGRWLTSQVQLQLDPPDTHLLRLKSAGVSFVNEQAWLLSSARTGQFLHILAELLQLIAEGQLRPPEARLFRLDQCDDAVRALSERVPGRRIVFSFTSS